MATIKNLAQLKAAGGIVSREPVKKEVTWDHFSPEGEELHDTFDVYIVKPSFGSMLSIGKVTDREQLALTLSKTIMLENDKGKPEYLAYEDAMQLDPSLAMTLLGAVREVTEPKNSQRPTNSSANSSPAESAVAP
jgi:hypothetical protein